MDIQTAIRIVRNPNSHADALLIALEFLIDHAPELPRRVRFMIPGGHGVQPGPEWKKVLDNSVSCCSCGNPRTIVPPGAHTAFEAGQTVVLKAGESLFFGPAGGDREETYLGLGYDAQRQLLLWVQSPFSPTVHSHLMGCNIVEAPQAPNMFRELLDETPLLLILGFDQAAQELTIQLDKDIELVLEKMKIQAPTEVLQH